MNAFTPAADTDALALEALSMLHEKSGFSFDGDPEANVGAIIDWIEQALAGDIDTITVKPGQFIDLWGLAGVSNGDIDILDSAGLLDGSSGLTFGLVDLLGEPPAPGLDDDQFNFDGDGPFGMTDPVDDEDDGAGDLSAVDDEGIDAPEPFGLTVPSGDSLADLMKSGPASAEDTFDFGADGDLETAIV